MINSIDHELTNVGFRLLTLVTILPAAAGRDNGEQRRNSTEIALDLLFVSR